MLSLRTAEMSDIDQVIIARNKKVSQEMIDLAKESDIVLIQSNYSLYRISGKASIAVKRDSPLLHLKYGRWDLEQEWDCHILNGTVISWRLRVFPVKEQQSG